MIQITNKDFDNDDNPYIKIRSKIKTNKGITQMDMVPCEDISWVPDDLIKKWYVGQFYCPDYTNEHFMLASYYHDEYSMVWYDIMKCDPEERALLGKECASNDEIDDYMESNAISLIAN